MSSSTWLADYEAALGVRDLNEKDALDFSACP